MEYIDIFDENNNPMGIVKEKKQAHEDGDFHRTANIDSNKGNAVKKLLEILNIKKEETIAIGDDINDLSMFEQVGYKVAVDNAIDIVKENADEIILSNDENGVAVFLDRLLKDQIKVNCVAPGWVDTEMNKELTEDFVKEETERILLKRFAEPEEFAKVVTFLASEDASFVNSTVIKVDGGWY